MIIDILLSFFRADSKNKIFLEKSILNVKCDCLTLIL